MSEHQLPVPVMLTPEQIAVKMATGHSVFSPSGAEMSMTCAESLILNALAEDVQTEDAAIGTVAHSVAEQWLISDERPDHLVGTIEEIKGFEVEITEEMLGFVEDFVTLCQDLAVWAEHSHAESRVDISHLTPIPDQGGTADFLAFRWQKMKIVDLKYGKDPVPAFENKQLRVYASGVFHEWDWLYNFQEIEIIIVQPRLPGGTTRWMISREELMAFEDFARERWAIAWQPNATRTPSIKGCRWCKVRAKCPALYLFMAQEMSDVFEKYDDDGVIDAEYSHDEMATANELILDDLAPSPFPSLPVPAELSTTALAKLLRYRKLMETFFNAVAAELLSRAVSDEDDIPWWKVVESRTQRRIVDDKDWVIEQLVGQGLDRDDLFETKLLSPGKLERLMHTKLKWKLTQAKRWLTDSGLTVKPPGQKTLAAVSDNREALSKDTDVFEIWEDI